MNKKKVFGIVGGILLVLLILFLILNPAWVTHPKYMFDSKYCEQDSDCSMCEGGLNKYILGNKVNYCSSSPSVLIAICNENLCTNVGGTDFIQYLEKLNISKDFDNYDEFKKFVKEEYLRRNKE